MSDPRMTPESYEEMLEVPVEEWNEVEFELVQAFKAEREFADRKCIWTPTPTGTGHVPGCGKYSLAFADMTTHEFCPFCGGEIEEKKKNDNRIRPS